MHVVEVIHLRLSSGYEIDPVSLIHNFMNGSGSVSFHLYRHATLESDFTIHVHHESSALEIPQTGKALASFLKDFGLVNYSLWTKCEKPDSA